jgi:hypothetical protein
MLKPGGLTFNPFQSFLQSFYNPESGKMHTSGLAANATVSANVAYFLQPGRVEGSLEAPMRLAFAETNREHR